MSNIFTVKQLTTNIKGNLEKHFPFVWVKGEVSNLARPSSGHLYFSLKDNDALLNCVWFKNSQRSEEKFDPLTGEVFEDGPRPSMAHTLANGQEILCAGSVSVYAPRGSYQLIVTLAQEGGRGALYAAFEALKLKLEGQGFFAQARKRPLPPNPRRIAVITAPTGAAIHDFLRIADTRGTGSSIDIYPVPVQGDAAAPAIAKAFERIAESMGTAQAPQIIVLIRGGGSLEDLWAFNEEAVAHAIFTSPLPVIAGIGHEVDISMADLTADVRAATPTHAAQLLWPLREEYMQRLDGLEMALQDAGEALLQSLYEKLQHKEQALKWLSPEQAWQRKEDELKQFVQKLQWYKDKILERKERELQALEQKLPTLVQNYEQVHTQLDSIQMRLWHGLERVLARAEQNFARHEYALPPLMRRQLTQWESALQKLELELKAYDPMAPLGRGYALVKDAQGQILRSVQDIQAGQDISLQVADGGLAATVKKTWQN